MCEVLAAAVPPAAGGGEGGEQVHTAGTQQALQSLWGCGPRGGATPGGPTLGADSTCNSRLSHGDRLRKWLCFGPRSSVL